MEKKLLPFDLEKALAGAKVVTRDGDEVRNIRIRSNALHPLRGELSDYGNLSWELDGRFLDGTIDHDNDLFLLDESESQKVEFDEVWMKEPNYGMFHDKDIAFRNWLYSKLPSDVSDRIADIAKDVYGEGVHEGDWPKIESIILPRKEEFVDKAIEFRLERKAKVAYGFLYDWLIDHIDKEWYKPEVQPTNIDEALAEYDYDEILETIPMDVVKDWVNSHESGDESSPVGLRTREEFVDEFVKKVPSVAMQGFAAHEELAKYMYDWVTSPSAPKPKTRKVVKWAVSFCSSDSKERFMSVGLYDTFEEAQNDWVVRTCRPMYHKIEWEEDE